MAESIIPAREDTIKERDSSIPCISTTKTKRGRFLDHSYFDVPDEEYGEGFLRGTEIAHALFKEMQTTRLRRLSMVMSDAMQNFDSSVGMPSKRGAASGLCSSVFGILEHASTILNLEQCALMHMNRCKISYEKNEARKATEKSEFVARMANARNVKRTASAQEVCHVC